MKFVGGDPGKHGGMALIWTDENLAVIGYECWAFDLITEPELASRLKLIAADANADGPRPVVLVEKQGSRTAMRRNDVAILHHSWGFIRGVLSGCVIPFEDVAPATWQRPMKLIMPKGTTYSEKKKKHKAMAQRLFPEVTVTASTCDALLIAEYGRRQYQKGVACG